MVSREELYADLTEGLRARWAFAVMVAVAAVVAAGVGSQRPFALVMRSATLGL